MARDHRWIAADVQPEGSGSHFSAIWIRTNSKFPVLVDLNDLLPLLHKKDKKKKKKKKLRNCTV